jgi:hypothetical protein
MGHVRRDAQESERLRSVPTGRNEPDSAAGFDLLIDVGPGVGLFALGGMRKEAERMIGRAEGVSL